MANKRKLSTFAAAIALVGLTMLPSAAAAETADAAETAEAASPQVTPVFVFRDTLPSRVASRARAYLRRFAREGRPARPTGYTCSGFQCQCFGWYDCINMTFAIQCRQMSCTGENCTCLHVP